MAKTRLQLGHLNIAELIALAQQVHYDMFENPAFAALKSQVGGLLDEINEMIITNEGCQEALQTIQQRLTQRHDQRALLESLLNRLAVGVENISGGNTGLLPSAGFDVPTTPALSAASRSQAKLSVGMERVAAMN